MVGQENIHTTFMLIRTKLEVLEREMEEGERCGIIKAQLDSIEQLSNELRASQEGNELFSKFLEELHGWIANLESFLPESLMREDDKKRLLDSIWRWRGMLNGMQAMERYAPVLHLTESFVSKYRSARIGSVQRGEVQGDLNSLKSYLDNICMNFRDEQKIQEIKKEFDVYLNQVESSREPFTQADLDRLITLLNSLYIRLQPVLAKIPTKREEEARATLPPPLPPGMTLWIDVGGEKFPLDISKHEHVIIGRYDPGGLDPAVGEPPDGLKVKDPHGSILHVFNSVQCRWGCTGEDEDCTHREHVELSIRGNEVKVSLCRGARLPVYYSFSEKDIGKPLRESIVLKLGENLFLWISGVYVDERKSRKVPVKLHIAPSRRITQESKK